MFLEAGGNVRTEFEDPDGFVFPVRTMVEEGSLDVKVRDFPYLPYPPCRLNLLIPLTSSSHLLSGHPSLLSYGSLFLFMFLLGD